MYPTLQYMHSKFTKNPLNYFSFKSKMRELGQKTRRPHPFLACLGLNYV